jgi:hypothetical protein
MDRRSGRAQAQPRRVPAEQARPVLWSTATVKRRRAADYSALAYTRRYLGRMIVVLTLVTPLLIVMTYQWAPRRALHGSDDLWPVALAATQSGSTDRRVQAARAAPDRTASLASQLGQGAGISLGQGAGISGVSNPSLTGDLTDDWLSTAARPPGWYRTAAAEYRVSPYLLEALHHVESSAATDGCLPNMEGSGAVGPLQFRRATFAEHGIDGNGDGVVDICGFVDSLMSAAAYLRALGADHDLDGPAVRQALERYGTDVDRVLDVARSYRARDGSLTAGTPPER